MTLTEIFDRRHFQRQGSAREGLTQPPFAAAVAGRTGGVANRPWVLNEVRRMGTRGTTSLFIKRPASSAGVEGVCV
jgi:hypothetical protein